jgi:solute carrier family 25 protein 42
VKKELRKLGTAELLAAGGLAGALSKSIIAPADRVKILYQVDPYRHFSISNAIGTAAKIYKDSGFTALWRGNGATLMRVIPYAAIGYYCNDLYCARLLALAGLAEGTMDGGDGLAGRSKQAAHSDSFEQQPTGLDRMDGLDRHGGVGRSSGGVAFLKSSANISTDFLPIPAQLMACRFAAGAAAGASATVVTYPFDLLRARMAATFNPRFDSSYGSAVREIVQKEGVGSLWSGVRPTLVGIVPYAGISFGTFGTVKTLLVERLHLNNEREIPTPMRLGAGMVSGLIAQSLTYPLDIVRRRMQVQHDRPGIRYTGVVHALSTIYKQEGLTQGLYKGLTMNWIKGPIAVGVSFTANDAIREWLREIEWGEPQTATGLE